MDEYLKFGTLGRPVPFGLDLVGRAFQRPLHPWGEVEGQALSPLPHALPGGKICDANDVLGGSRNWLF